MQFASYSAFRTSLYTLIEGEELGETFSVNTLDLMIGLGEGRVYHGDAMTPGLRASTMQEPLSVVIASNAATLPADLLELKEVRFSGEKPLEIVPLDRLRRLGEDYASAGSAVRYCAQDGDTLVFWPEASGTVIGSYYAQPESLESVAWANATTFARYPELFTYACLFECALFLGHEKLPVWEARYRQLADGANHSERMRVYGGGRLRVRTS